MQIVVQTYRVIKTVKLHLMMRLRWANW